MNMDAYFRLADFKSHPHADHYRRELSGKRSGEIRRGMLLFTPETACSWGGPYPVDAAHFILTLETAEGWLSFADARKEAQVKLAFWAKQKCKGREHFKEMLVKVDALDADAIHQTVMWGTKEYPYRLSVRGNDDCSYAKWFKTLEDAEAFLGLLESAGPLDYSKDFLTFTWTFTN